MLWRSSSVMLPKSKVLLAEVEASKVGSIASTTTCKALLSYLIVAH